MLHLKKRRRQQQQVAEVKVEEEEGEARFHKQMKVNEGFLYISGQTQVNKQFSASLRL